MNTDHNISSANKKAPLIPNANDSSEVSESGEVSDVRSLISDISPVDLIANPDTLVFNQIISDTDVAWQIHNCKIIDKSVTQNEKLPFIYHYDSLPEDVKSQYPLNSQLLKQFQTPLYANEAADLLNISKDLIKTPWQVKITGTLVMFSERLQIALRLKFTNTAKQRDPIYTESKEDAIKIAMKNWHFYGDVFVLNKNNRPMVMTLEEQWMHIPRSEDYRAFPVEYAQATLAILEEYKEALPQLDESISLRLI